MAKSKENGHCNTGSNLQGGGGEMEIEKVSR